LRRARSSTKNALSCDAHSVASTPSVTSKRWLSRGSLPIA